MSTVLEVPPGMARSDSGPPAASVALLRAMLDSEEPRTRLAAMKLIDPEAARQHKELLRQADEARTAINAAEGREEKRYILARFAGRLESNDPGLIKRCVSAARTQRVTPSQKLGSAGAAARPRNLPAHRATRAGRATTARRTASHTSTTRSTSAGDAGGDSSGDSPGPGDGPREARPTVGATPAGVGA